MKPKIGISEKNLKNSASSLECVLADEMTLYIKTRKFHWNVSGESFMELHKLFEGQYQQIETSIDAVAERINKLGSKTIGTMAEFIKYSRLKEAPHAYPSQKDMIKELLDDHETLVVQLRKDIELAADKNEDLGTADFLTGLMEQHETDAWVLRRYLQ